MKDYFDNQILMGGSIPGLIPANQPPEEAAPTE